MELASFRLQANLLCRLSVSRQSRTLGHPRSHTCSWSSARRWARSSSESSVEDSEEDEEELELSEEEPMRPMGGWGLTGAGWCSSVGGGGTASGFISSSSGILAKRISNTSCGAEPDTL